MKKLPKAEAGKIWDKIIRLGEGESGDVRRLTGSVAEYSLRVGKYRRLFEMEGRTIFVYRVSHRRDAYKRLQ